MRLHLLADVAALLLVAGCAAGGPSAGGGADPAGGAVTSQGAAATESFDSPEPEPTTPDASGSSSSNDDPAISVARLPIGGDAQDDESDTGLQCAHVTWIASDDGQIPEGTGVEVTRVAFDPAVFDAVADGCGAERPGCRHHVFRSDALQCDLAVRAIGDVPQDANPSLGFGGLVFCPDDDSDECRRFVAALADQQQLSVSLNVPQLPQDSSGPASSDGG